MSGRFGSNPAVLSRSVEKRGDQSRFKCRRTVNYYAIRSIQWPYRRQPVSSHAVGFLRSRTLLCTKHTVVPTFLTHVCPEPVLANRLLFIRKMMAWHGGKRRVYVPFTHRSRTSRTCSVRKRISFGVFPMFVSSLSW
jgi:hypothetical protein